MHVHCMLLQHEKNIHSSIQINKSQEINSSYETDRSAPVLHIVMAPFPGTFFRYSIKSNMFLFVRNLYALFLSFFYQEKHLKNSLSYDDILQIPFL